MPLCDIQNILYTVHTVYIQCILYEQHWQHDTALVKIIGKYKKHTSKFTYKNY